MRKHQYKDITGQKFGKLVVLDYTKTIDKRPHWKCKCDCGKIVEKRGKELKSGLIQSCGCLLIKRGPDDNVIGKRFSFLSVLECVGQKNNRKSYWWKCKCDCGNIIEVSIDKLNSGHTKSCGCLIRKVSSKRAIIRNKEMSGSNHPRWNFNLTDEEREAAKEARTNDPKLNRWRKKVYDRDGYKCVKCKDDRGGNLTAHHIYSWNSHPNLRYITNNGSTLCEDCHKVFHIKYGYGNNNRKQYNEWRKV